MDKQKALKNVIADIEKKFGEGSILTLDKSSDLGIPSIPTGLLSLDLALGIGGLPKGRIVEIFGPEASGKTTLALSVVAEAQKDGGICAIVDAEHALDINYATKMGVNIESLMISQPDSGEQALSIVDSLIDSKLVDIIIVDSVAALVPQAEIEAEIGKNTVGLQARLMSQSLRKFASTTTKADTMLIFINQLREKIGITWGSPETTPGGKALKFYSSVRLDVRRIGQLKKNDEVVGGRTRVKVVKNKVAPPFKQAEFDILHSCGVNKLGDLVDCAVDKSIVNKAGAWYSYNNTKLGQGREKVMEVLAGDDKMRLEIEGLVLAALFTDGGDSKGKNSDGKKTS